MKLDSTWVRFSRSMPAWRLPISSWLHMTSFVMRTPNGLLPTISSAVSSAASTTAPSGTTLVTSPMRSASAASMSRPVSSSSNARDAPTRRGSIHDTPMSQPDSPTRMNATLKRALAAAMRTSLASASASPPPDAAPFTAAMIGCGTERIFGTRPGDQLLHRHARLGAAHRPRRRRARALAEVEAGAEARGPRR